MWVWCFLSNLLCLDISVLGPLQLSDRVKHPTMVSLVGSCSLVTSMALAGPLPFLPIEPSVVPLTLVSCLIFCMIPHWYMVILRESNLEDTFLGHGICRTWLQFCGCVHFCKSSKNCCWTWVPERCWHIPNHIRYAKPWLFYFKYFGLLWKAPFPCL